MRPPLPLGSTQISHVVEVFPYAVPFSSSFRTAPPRWLAREEIEFKEKGMILGKILPEKHNRQGGVI
jgi:hypothetical protein